MTAALRRMLATAAACAAAIASALTLTVPLADGYTASVSVSHAPVAGPIAPSFLGLALVYSEIPPWVGSTGTVNQPLVGLLRGLAPRGGTVLRIGGETADHSWWPVPGLRKPLGALYQLDGKWAKAAQAIAKATE